jgi:Sulfotransferase family
MDPQREVTARTEAGPPFFIVGSARSGTTLLRLMLNAHPDIAVPPESRFVVELYKGSDTVMTSELLVALAGHKRFQAWDLPIEAVREELGPTPSTEYADAMRAAYRAYARVHGKVRWGDKTPRYVEHLPFLAKLFPDARFIHLVRDGRNVALSYADVPFGPKTIAKAARLWAERVASGVANGRDLGARRYMEIRYEDMVEDAKGQARQVCDFLELPFDPGMLEYTERARDAILPRAGQYNPHVVERPRPHVRTWERDMPDSHVEIFEAVAGPVLDRLGYERRHAHPSPSARVRGLLGRLGLPLDHLRSTT